MSVRAIVLATLLAGAALPLTCRSAWACDADLVDVLLSEAEAQLSYGVRASELDASRAHLRRGAFIMAEAEAQLISCNCIGAAAEASSAVTEIRRAAAATQLEEMAIAVEASVIAFQTTVDALSEDICR